MSSSNSKLCTRCHKTKSPSEFSSAPDKRLNKGCNTCLVWQKNWRADQKQKEKKQQQEPVTAESSKVLSTNGSAAAAYKYYSPGLQNTRALGGGGHYAPGPDGTITAKRS